MTKIWQICEGTETTNTIMARAYCTMGLGGVCLNQCSVTLSAYSELLVRLRNSLRVRLLENKKYDILSLIMKYVVH